MTTLLAFAAELIAPREQARCEGGKRVLVGHANRAEDLVSDARALGRRGAGAHFCREDVEPTFQRSP